MIENNYAFFFGLHKDIITKMESPQRPSGIPKATPKLRFSKTFSKSNDGNLNGSCTDSIDLDTFTLLEENSSLKDEKQNLIDKLTEGIKFSVRLNPIMK